MPPTKTRYAIELRPEPGDVPGIVRLRRLLKSALRGYGLRCVAVRELAGEDDAGASQGADAAEGPESQVRSQPQNG